MKWALLILLGVTALAAEALPQKPAAQRKIPCKTPANAATCRWIHGRLTYVAGKPSYRMWKIGTRRILGIYSGPSIRRDESDASLLDSDHPEFPAVLETIIRAEGTTGLAVFGDFEVCMLEPERAGAMQSACIEAAKNLVGGALHSFGAP